MTNESEIRERIGVTGACEDGKIAHEPTWFVQAMDNGRLEVLDVQADSPASQVLLSQVCEIGRQLTSSN